MKHLRLIIVVALTFLSGLVKGQSKYGPNDTLMVAAIVVDGDTIPIKWLTGVYVWKGGKRQKKEWTRLRNAVYVTYPYARKAGQIWNDIENRRPAYSKKELKKYIDSREKELKKEFTKPMKNLSVYQGKILMKLINRETGGTDCYDVVKTLKGGFSARFWQTVAFFFGGDLKQPYDPYGNDAEIESIVQEVMRMYGYSS